MIAIRDAVESDIPRIIEMGHSFVKEGPYKNLPIDDKQVTTFATFLVTWPQAKVLLAEREGRVIGIIAMLVTPHFFTGQLTAQELLWYVDKEERHSSAGIDLLFTAQMQAREMGAVKMLMASADPRIGMAYERLGYKPVEVGYERLL